MKRLLRASVIALSLLISTATVYSECAWVLWESDLTLRTGETSDKRWSVLDSSANLPDCKSSAAKKVDVSIQHEPLEKGGPPGEHLGSGEETERGEQRGPSWDSSHRPVTRVGLLTLLDPRPLDGVARR